MNRRVICKITQKISYIKGDYQDFSDEVVHETQAKTNITEGNV